jgi:hypothetical protein
LCVVATSIAERRAARIGTSRLLDQEFAGGMIDRVRWAFMGGAAWGDFDEVADEGEPTAQVRAKGGGASGRC